MKVVVGLYDEKRYNQACEALKEYPGAFRKAQSDAIKRMNSFINRRAQELITKEYDISRADVRKEGTVTKRVSYTPGGEIVSTTAFKGQLIALYKFHPNPSQDIRQSKKVFVDKGLGRVIRVSPSVLTKAHLAKDKPMTKLNDAFVATMPTGHIGIWERTGERTRDGAGPEEIRELTGNSVAHMVGYGEIADQILSEAADRFITRLDSNVQRIREGKWKI